MLFTPERYRSQNSERSDRQLKRTRIFLGLIAALALALSLVIVVPTMAATPPNANNNNVQMSLSGIPTTQQSGENVNYSMTVSNPQSLAPLYSADAANMTVTFYPAQADGTPSTSGTVVGTITYLAVNAPSVPIGPVTYPMPNLNPGVTAAVSRAVLNGTILLGSGAGLPFSITKEVSIELLVEPVGGTAFPVNKPGLLAPLAGLLACAGVGTLLVLRKRRQA
jgi:hypothetical protein